MRILALYSIKGGVGKTASAVNLAYLSARSGARTLVWDLDPQGAASFYFRVRPKVKGGAQGLLSGRKPLEGLIRGTDFECLDLLPADFSYRRMDLLLNEAKNPRQRLERVLAALQDEYDCVILDCAPGITLASESVFQAAQALLVPVIPTTLSLRTLQQLRQHREGLGQGSRILPFFSMVDRRKSLHRKTLEAALEERWEMLSTPIPYASEVELMGLRRAPLAAYAPASSAAQAYDGLWKEVALQLAAESP